MLPLTMIASLVLLGFLGTSVNGYTISRTQDYPSYSASSPTQTFSSLKEAQESIASTNYAPVSSPRQYSTLYGGHSSSGSYGDASPQSSTYGSHSAASDALNSLSSYQNDAADLGSSYSAQGLDYASAAASQHGSSPSVTYSGYSGGQSEQLSGLEYASSAPVSASYTSGGAGSSYGGSSPSYTSSSNPSSSYSSSSPVSASYSASSPVSASYSASSPVGASYSASGPVGASYSPSTPVATSYTSSGYTGPKGHGPSYTSTSTVSFGHQGSAANANHFPSSSHYPSESSQSSYADSPRYPASLKNFMNSVHRDSSGAYFARPSTSGGSHGSNYIHSPTSFTKGPGSYFGGGAFPKSGGKIIIVKDGHAMMHPESSFSGSMGFPAGSNYKVRNAGPFSSGHHFQGSSSSYSHPSIYSGGPSSHPGGASSPYFQY